MQSRNTIPGDCDTSEKLKATVRSTPTQDRYALLAGLLLPFQNPGFVLTCQNVWFRSDVESSKAEGSSRCGTLAVTNMATASLQASLSP